MIFRQVNFMTLKEIVFIETLSILTEEKVGSLVDFIIKKYDGSYGNMGNRIEAVYSMKNEKDKRLYSDDDRPIAKKVFHQACIEKFDQRAAKEKIKIPRNEFIITLNNYLSVFNADGKLLPRASK